jgi:PTS system mannose-specific IID component
MIPGARAAFRRLLIFQASWTYERLQGIGMGFASLPLLEPLRGEPEKYAAAVARASDYFNAHPYLAGIAVGAAARAELDGVPGPTVSRLRTALAGPLGSLGDQLFWIGVVPAVMGALLIAVALDAGLWPVIVGLVLYVAVRLLVTRWGLELGLAAGARVAQELKRSGLERQVQRVGLLAGFAVGLALPLVVEWFARPVGPRVRLVAAVGAGIGIAAALVPFRVPPARRVTLIAMIVVLLWHWSAR